MKLVAPGCTLFARADNIFDKNYELAAGFGTGGATVFAGAGASRAAMNGASLQWVCVFALLGAALPAAHAAVEAIDDTGATVKLPRLRRAS